jgi:hypothetical protein
VYHKYCVLYQKQSYSFGLACSRGGGIAPHTLNLRVRCRWMFSLTIMPFYPSDTEKEASWTESHMQYRSVPYAVPLSSICSIAQFYMQYRSVLFTVPLSSICSTAQFHMQYQSPPHELSPVLQNVANVLRPTVRHKSSCYFSRHVSLYLFLYGCLYWPHSSCLASCVI